MKVAWLFAVTYGSPSIFTYFRRYRHRVTVTLDKLTLPLSFVDRHIYSTEWVRAISCYDSFRQDFGSGIIICTTSVPIKITGKEKPDYINIFMDWISGYIILSGIKPESWISVSGLTDTCRLPDIRSDIKFKWYPGHLSDRIGYPANFMSGPSLQKH